MHKDCIVCACMCGWGRHTRGHVRVQLHHWACLPCVSARLQMCPQTPAGGRDRWFSSRCTHKLCGTIAHQHMQRPPPLPAARPRAAPDNCRVGGSSVGGRTRPGCCPLWLAFGVSTARVCFQHHNHAGGSEHWQPLDAFQTFAPQPWLTSLVMPGTVQPHSTCHPALATD